MVLLALLALAPLGPGSPSGASSPVQDLLPSLSPRPPETTAASQPWWQEPNVVSTSAIPTETARLVNVVGWGHHVEHTPAQQYTWRQAARTQARGGHYVGSISTYNATHQTYTERPELSRAAVIDVYGRPMTVPWASNPQKPAWWGNTNDPLWQAFLLEQARTLVDLGVDGILIDEIGGTLDSIWSGGSFGEPDRSAFRAYLAQRYTREELRDRYGIADITAFDYRTYIHDRGLAETWMNAPWQVPLYPDLVRFQQAATIQFVQDLIRQTRDYAQRTYGRSIAFTGNLFGLYPTNLAFADQLDYVTAEYPYSKYGYPPQSQAIPDYKLSRALGKPAVTVPSMATNADLAGRSASSTLMTLYIAEAYASQGAFMVPYDLPGWDQTQGAVRYYGDMTTLAPLYRFVQENTFLYKDLDSLADVAVLYSFATDFYTRDGYRDPFRGLTYALLDGQSQFDILALGDGTWLADRLSAASLAPYALVFVPKALYLADRQVDVLLSFVAKGGTLVAWGSTGAYDEMGHPVQRPQLEGLKTPGTHTYGNGRFITLADDPGAAYVRTHDPAARQRLRSLVDQYAGGVTATTAGRTLNLLAYSRSGGSQIALHLLNYDYSIQDDRVRPTGPFALTVEPPPGFLDQAGVQFYLLSPHRPSPLLIDSTAAGSQIVVNHPGLYLYDVLLGIPEAQARALSAETLDALACGMSQAGAEGYDTRPLNALLAQIQAAQAANNHLLARQRGLEALDSLRALTRRRVLFDEAHAERNTLSWTRAQALRPDHPDWVYFGALAAELADEFDIEHNPDAPLSTQLLSQYDALIMAAPEETLGSAENRAVQQFVQEGGGLLVLGDCGLDASLNSLVLNSHITYDPHCIYAPIPQAQGEVLIDSLRNHEATVSVPFMVMSWGQSLTAAPPSVSLMATRTDAWLDANWNNTYDSDDPTGTFAVGAAYQADSGRIVALADNAFQDNGLYWRSNDLLLRAVLRWLTHWRPTCERHSYLPLVLRTP